MINLLVTFSMVSYSSVLTANLIIGEYAKKTVLILFSYPLDRKKIMLIKLGVISVFTMLCILIGNLLCHLYLIGVNTLFHLVTGSPDLQYLSVCLTQALFGSLMGGILSLIPFVLGMQKSQCPLPLSVRWP